MVKQMDRTDEVRSQLMAVGLDVDHAEAVMRAYRLAGTDMTAERVEALCRELDGPDPNAAASALLEDRWSHRRVR